MHQTFYIDVDEEISSVIDRLKKSVSAENYFVVPKRALFVQSIINLKLLKREADNLQKRIILVTQDEFGINMAEKAGLEVKTSPEDQELLSSAAEAIETSADVQPVQPILQTPEVAPVEKKPSSIRLRMVGTDDYYGGEKEEHPGEVFVPRNYPTLHVPVRESESNLRQAQPLPARPPAKEMPVENKAAAVRRPMRADISLPQKKEPARQPRIASEETAVFGRGLDSKKEQTIEKMFRPVPAQIVADSESQAGVKVGRRGRKIITGFIVLCAAFFVGAAAYVFVPSAAVEITLDAQKKVLSTQIAGSAGTSLGIDGTAIAVPVRIVKKEDNVSLTYDSSGTSPSTTGKKAQGSVVIYNAFSSSPQTLIATTRLETQDGKIFRLAKTVTVPGMSGSGSSAKPGAIETDVVADQPGDAYNIESATFTIPGFAGSPKFDAFSAKSAKPMTGGVSDGASPRAVSEQDIAGAKDKAENALKEKLKADILANVQKGDIVLDQAEKTDISQSSASAKAGDAGDAFTYSASGTMTALVFSGDDVMNMAGSLANKDVDVKKFSAAKMSAPNYSEVTADFDAQTLKANIDAQATLIPLLDANKFKNNIAGKDQSQIKQIVSQTFGIKNVNIDFFPPFVSTVPKFTQRITVKVNTGE